MLTLAIETSSFGGSVGLLRGTEFLGERRMDPQRRHAQMLVAEIGRLCETAGVLVADCQLIAVSHGPGSFTGLRVGVVCAKTLAYATGANIAAVPTFLATAVQAPAEVDRVQIIMNAQREELFQQEFRRDEHGQWSATTPLSIVKVRDWLTTLTPVSVVSGPALEALQPQLSGVCQVLERSLWTPSAESIARLGQRQLERGELTSCRDLEPLYIRKSAAEEKWDATHAPETPAVPSA